MWSFIKARGHYRRWSWWALGFNLYTTGATLQVGPHGWSYFWK